MKVFLDTNVLASATLFPKSTVALAYDKAVSAPYTAFTSDVVIKELSQIFNRKFPNKIVSLTSFLNRANEVIEIVDTPEVPVIDEMKLRDIKDRPILRAAIVYNADYFLTGDKDFLESNIVQPQMIAPAEFLRIA